jgi:hypothetical protein
VLLMGRRAVHTRDSLTAGASEARGLGSAAARKQACACVQRGDAEACWSKLLVAVSASAPLPGEGCWLCVWILCCKDIYVLLFAWVSSRWLLCLGCGRYLSHLSRRDSQHADRTSRCVAR